MFAPDLPVFNLEKREGAESIFAEADDEEEVFSSTAGTRVAIPELPREHRVEPPMSPTPPLPPLAAPRQDSVPYQPYPVPSPSPPVQEAIPAAPAIGERPPAQPVAFDELDPWTGMSSVAKPTLQEPEVTSASTQLESAEPRSSRARKPAAASRTADSRPASLFDSIPKPALAATVLLLFLYSVLMTVLAVYGLVFKSDRAPPDHPLSTIPDDFGEFPPAERKKISKRSLPRDGELPPELKVGLGEKLEIGALEIMPLRVEARPLAIFVKSGSRVTPEPELPYSALVVSLRISNRSTDLTLHPVDPAFTRKSRGGDHPATCLEIGGRKYWGGAIDWPLTNDRISRVYEHAQEEDVVPLAPGDTRDYVVFTDADPRIVAAVRDAAAPILWRVKVRRGRIDYRGNDVPVTAIIGIVFDRSDVAGLG